MKRIRSLEPLSIQEDETQPQSPIFRDLHLDFQQNFLPTLPHEELVYENDIETDINGKAVGNSLLNLLNTRNGQRFLFPQYGVNLYDYLFEAITTDNARILGENLQMAIEEFEPRIKLKKIQVIPQYDKHQYDINIFYSSPALEGIMEIPLSLELESRNFLLRP
jgi:phage baseplate assembly protein W